MKNGTITDITGLAHLPRAVSQATGKKDALHSHVEHRLAGLNKRVIAIIREVNDAVDYYGAEEVAKHLTMPFSQLCNVGFTDMAHGGLAFLLPPKATNGGEKGNEAHHVDSTKIQAPKNGDRMPALSDIPENGKPTAGSAKMVTELSFSELRAPIAEFVVSLGRAQFTSGDVCDHLTQRGFSYKRQYVSKLLTHLTGIQKLSKSTPRRAVYRKMAGAEIAFP